jgi:hypothetical protein
MTLEQKYEILLECIRWYLNHSDEGDEAKQVLEEIGEI